MMGVKTAATLAGLAALFAVPAQAQTWTNADSKARITREAGVSVIRGPERPRKRFSGDAALEAALEGGLADRSAGVRVNSIYVRPKTVVVVDFRRHRPNVLTTHGFTGVRRYNRSVGRFPGYVFSD